MVTAFGAKTKYIQNKLESRELLYEAKNSLSQVNPRGQFPSVINENEFSTPIIRENSKKSTENAKNSSKNSDERFSIDVNSPKVQRETAWAKETNVERSSVGKFVDEDNLIDNYTEKQYNDFGWARANDVLTARENAVFRSKYKSILKIYGT